MANIGTTSPKVHAYLSKNRNLDVNIKDIMEGTGLTEMQVRNACQLLKTRPGIDLQVIIAGHVYRLVSNPNSVEDDEMVKPAAFIEPIKTSEPSKRVFEELGTTKDGRIVIQDADGKLYEAKELQ